MTPGRRVRAWALAGFTLLVGTTATTRAGDRELEILVVNMTPDAAVTDATRKCFAQVRARIRKDYARMHGLGETVLRRLAQNPVGPYMTWTEQTLQPVREARHDDAIALVDCRPAQASADILVTSSNHRAARLRLRDVKIDQKLAHWLGEAILRHAWVGFVP